MNLGLKSRVALVAAASRGLGKAVALRLAQEGASVAVCSRSDTAIQEAADDIAQRTGSTVLAVPCDVTRQDQVARLVERVADELGDIDILITNAGGPPAGMAADFTPDDYRNAVELNLMSTITMVSAVLPAMRSKDWGRIIAVTSIAARQPIPNLILSNTARAGVLGYLKSLSAQVGQHGITVNAVCPGYTRTERVEELARSFTASGKGSEEEFYAAIEGDIPLARMGTPEEFASVVAFLASQGAGYITGVALPIDGGYSKGLY